MIEFIPLSRGNCSKLRKWNGSISIPSMLASWERWDTSSSSVPFISIASWSGSGHSHDLEPRHAGGARCLGYFAYAESYTTALDTAICGGLWLVIHAPDMNERVVDA